MSLSDAVSLFNIGLSFILLTGFGVLVAAVLILFKRLYIAETVILEMKKSRGTDELLADVFGHYGGFDDLNKKSEQKKKDSASVLKMVKDNESKDDPIN